MIKTFKFCLHWCSVLLQIIDQYCLFLKTFKKTAKQFTEEMLKIFTFLLAWNNLILFKDKTYIMKKQQQKKKSRGILQRERLSKNLGVENIPEASYSWLRMHNYLKVIKSIFIWHTHNTEETNYHLSLPTLHLHKLLLCTMLGKTRATNPRYLLENLF